MYYPKLRRDTNYILAANQENTVKAYVLLRSNTNYTPTLHFVNALGL